MKLFSFIIFIAIFFLLFTCKSGANLDQPPTMRYGEDPCDECGMIINEARFAVAFVTTDGIARRFDDLGCLLRYHDKHGEKVANFWVNDYDNREWLNAQNAYFVESDSLTTPMGYGIVAVSNKQRAEEILTEVKSGSVKQFDELSQ